MSSFSIPRTRSAAMIIASASAVAVLASLALAGGPGTTPAESPAAEKAPDFPPFEKVSDGLEKVVSTADGGPPSLYTMWSSTADGRLIAELPKSYASQLIMIAPTVASGDENAGVMGGSIYAKWKRFDKRLALIEPNFVVRSTGDEQSKTSVEQLFTDRVILDVPIVAMGPGGGPVIDLKGLFVGQHAKFFGPRAGGWGPTVFKGRAHLVELAKAKAFPKNIEVTYELPAADGRLVALHYSLAALEESKTFKPRLADNRVGYFNVYFDDLGKTSPEREYTRYIARWEIEKADPKLSMSPPKEPLVWYIEHTTPVRYRRFVREGILAWNRAFEDIGIVNALEVYQQDAGTGAHMEKDPEDARYNFFRWNTSTQSYAIGPSRWDPRTGQIFDADVVWHAGLTKAVMSMYSNLTADIAIQGFPPETLAWLDDHPEWDPRVRLARPAVREQRLADHRHLRASLEEHTTTALGDVGAERMLEQHGRAMVQSHTTCRIGDQLAMNLGLVAAGLDAGASSTDDADAMLDELPEAVLGGMIRYISSHEVGHTLGLQHNFGASTIRTLEQINSEDLAGQPFIGSVMEYAAVNLNMDDGPTQGEYATPMVGPYDHWAIAFGYGPDDQRDEVLARVGEPDLVFLNDIATIGPDPRAQTWDMGADSLDFAESRMRIVRDLRSRIIDDIVKDGEPWRKARTRYDALLNTHMLTLVVSSRWIGGSYTNWDYKGDPGDRDPIEDVDSERQRRALSFIIENAFEDEAFGLTPELLHKLGTQYWPDPPGFESVFDDPSYEVHDLVSGIQAAALTIVMNPTRLRRLYDNEFRMAGEEHPITLAEVLSTVTNAIWLELDKAGNGRSTNAKPMISSFRRNLQREHLERLIALSMPSEAASPAMRTAATLSALKLREIRTKIDERMNKPSRMDEYSLAHLTDVKARIDRVLDAIYVYN